MEQRETPMTNADGLGESAIESVLSQLTQDLKHLQKDLIVQLTRDVTRLQAEKTRLLDDIAQLQSRHQQLAPSSPPPQLEESDEDRQAWMRQLAQVVAANVEEKLSARVEELAKRQLPPARPAARLDAAEMGDRLRDSVDTRFHRTYKGLSQELGSYRSDLSQSLHQLDSLQQQGEALLDTLVSRLSAEFQEDVSTAPSGRNGSGALPTVSPDTQPSLPQTDGDQLGDDGRDRTSGDRNAAAPAVPTPTAMESEIAESEAAGDPEPAPPPIPPKPASQVQQGLILALLYAAALSVFNVSIKVILSERMILGLTSWGGIISPSLGNSMLILFLRMVVVVVLMPIVANQLYPAWWDDIQQFLRPENRQLQYQVMGSGAALFLSQVLIYIAIGNIPTAVAITLFFIFPIVTVLGAWALFGARPTLARSVIMAVILFGSLSAVPDFFSVFGGGAAGSNFLTGSLTAIGSGITFAGYVLLTQICGKSLHPMPFSFANFSTVFVLSFLGLIFASVGNLGVSVPVGNLMPLLLGGAWLGVLTLVSYVLNNFAIKYAGASLASIVGATGPVMTAVFGFILIGEQLAGNQIFGMIVVTLGVVALSLERIYLAKK